VEDIQRLLEYAEANRSALNDSVVLSHLRQDSEIYQKSSFASIWSERENWKPLGDSLLQFIDSCRYYGLFPEDYHQNSLSFIRRVFKEDSLAKKNIALWARADLLLTDAFFSLVKDLNQGRLAYDSVTLRKDTILSDTFLMRTFRLALDSGSIRETFNGIESKYPGYDSVKNYLRSFLATAKFRPFTYLYYPYEDSIVFFGELQKRFRELRLIGSDSSDMDTTEFKTIIRKYQKAKGLDPTGRINDKTVASLNETDITRFKRIAINLDRYKLLPDSLPKTYIWVNLPTYIMKVMDSDTVVFESRVIVGKPDTRTPLLSSDVTNFVTLPQWTVPTSIIFKEMLPQIQKNTDYLRKENLIVVDHNDDVVDPAKVKWKKLSKRYFPYQIKQQEGDNNSLGVIKFNFRNRFSVYMHDTNVRWMFGKSFRALSHGCVRVQQWEKLSDFLIRNDTLRYHPDTLRAWIKRQEKHVISGFHRVPVYFRYFTCEGRNGHEKFYNDIYGEDKALLEKYFAGKTVH
jgi:murein L,D-transpeptidase YcbB/YkuD